MLDIGWTEMLVIAVLALIVIGPKDLPGALRTVGQWVRKARSLAREFQSGIDEMVREAELDEARKTLESTRRSNIAKTIKDNVDPEGELSAEAKSVEETARSASRLDDPNETAPKSSAKASNPDAGAAATGTQGGSGEPETAGHSAQAGEAPSGEGERRARVVSHPAKIAPGNSVRPPREDGERASSDETAESHPPKASGSAG
jgi:sec-independent protein translocase protein TatB